MGSEAETPKTPSIRHKCSACFKQYKKKEHLVEHMKISYHSIHQPKCGVCQKHCKSFESLREHLTGQLSKDNCSKAFYDQGCNLCMRVFDCPITRSVHKWSCCLPAPTPLGTVTASYTDALINASATARAVSTNKELEAIAMDCEMVGGGNDGSIGVCARVCLIDEDENVIFHTYVKPEIVVTDYRSKVTGLTEEHLRDAMPLKEVQEKVRDILHNAAKILVGHSLEYDLACLKLEYPEHLISCLNCNITIEKQAPLLSCNCKDTATYPSLMKTNLVSHSLKYLANTYLGYDIQYKIHDPYEDTVSVMRLYKHLRDQDHQTQLPSNAGFDAYQMEDLVKMSPDDLYEISRSGYRCWCLDRVHPWQL